MRKLPFDKAKLEEIAAKWPTPFHIYDAKAIRDNAKRLKKAFAWNKGFREYFAVKAAPNPYLMKLLKEFDIGSVADQEAPRFRITDDRCADWAVRKIAEERAEYDRLKELADQQVAAIT